MVAFRLSDVLKQLLNDTRVRAGLRVEFEHRQNADGDRVYSEFHTADHFQELVRRAPPGSKTLALACYMDGTWLSNNGKASCKPFVISIANVTRDVHNQDWAKKIMFHFQELGGSLKTRKSSRYRQVQFLFRMCAI